ncbi:hypothetical protein B7463_g10668, partial [Scytalidium lignicola]
MFPNNNSKLSLSNRDVNFFPEALDDSLTINPSVDLSSSELSSELSSDTSSDSSLDSSSKPSLEPSSGHCSLLLSTDNLKVANQSVQQKLKRSRKQIAYKGSLTAQEAQEIAQSSAIAQEVVEVANPEGTTQTLPAPQRRPPKYSGCGMEGLQSLASTIFKEQRFEHPLSNLSVLNISALRAGEAIYEEANVSEDVLEHSLMQTPRRNEDVEATLKLVEIPREDNETLRISKQTFLAILKIFGIDPYVQYMISRNSYGLHSFISQGSTSGKTYTVFIGNILYVLIWTFNPATATTNAIIMPRASNGFTTGVESFTNFKSIVTLYKEHIHTPHLLAFIASLQLSQFVDEAILWQLRLIRSVEARTGHGAYRNTNDTKESDIEDFTEWSMIIGTCLVNLANQCRHEQITTSIINHILYHTDIMWDKEMKEEHFIKHQDSLEVIKSVLPVLIRQAESARSYISYLQERAKNQSTVLFNLIAHQDSMINIGLADSSRKIAEETKKDGSAMKTIAVMTMAFLPATFFAALFAVPSLQWDKPGVIQSNFSVYWAFSIPATALVFIAWILITDWRMLLRWGDLIQKWRRKRKIKELIISLNEISHS